MLRVQVAVSIGILCLSQGAFGNDDYVRLRCVHRFTEVASIEGAGFSPDGKYAFYSSPFERGPAVAGIVSTETGAIHMNLTNEYGIGPRSGQFSIDGTRFLGSRSTRVSGENGAEYEQNFELWDVRTKEKIAALTLASPDYGSYRVQGASLLIPAEGKLLLLDFDNLGKAPLAEAKAIEVDGHVVRSEISPDGKYVAVSTVEQTRGESTSHSSGSSSTPVFENNPSIALYSTKTGDLISQSTTAIQAKVTDLAFLQTENQLYLVGTSFLDTHCYRWPIGKRGKINPPKVFRVGGGAKLSADGKTLVARDIAAEQSDEVRAKHSGVGFNASGMGGSVEIMDVASGKIIGIGTDLRSMGDFFSAYSFTIDGYPFAAALFHTNDASLSRFWGFWDLREDRFRGFIPNVSDLASIDLSPDGRMGIVNAYDQQTLQFMHTGQFGSGHAPRFPDADGPGIYDLTPLLPE